MSAHHHHKLDYVEFPACNIEASKAFFTAVFGWKFIDYGPDYTAFDKQGLEGGFYRADVASDADKGSALLIFYSHDLRKSQRAVTEAGGLIKRDIFDFPGGWRFHFTCPSGNEFAIWSDNSPA